MLIAYAAREVGNVMVRSRSGDIDIVTKFVSNLHHITPNVFIENGTGIRK